MKRFSAVILLILASLPSAAEVRVGVNTEFYNTFSSLTGIDEVWAYTMTGQAGLKFQNQGSRAIRGSFPLSSSRWGPPWFRR